MRKKTFVLLSLGAVLAAAALGAVRVADGASTSITVVGRGLNDPRGVTVAPDGAVYVAEAGRAGPACQGKGQNQQCGGLTSAITKLQNGTQVRIARGLISGGGKDGSFTVGADDVAVSPDFRVYAIVTYFGKAAEAVSPQVAKQQGKVLLVSPPGQRSVVSDISSVEFSQNPDGSAKDTDPYSIAWSPGGLIVADAAGNDILRVDSSGHASVVAVIPPERYHGKTIQAVPTSVAVGPDGAYYVGQLGGDGFPGAAHVWRVVPGQKPQIWASGFTAINGLDFGPDGSLYVTELVKHGLQAAQKGDLKGALIRIWPNGQRTEIAPGRLTALGGVGVGRDGTVYVSTNSLFAKRGEVLAIRP